MAARLALGCCWKGPARFAARRTAHTRECETDVKVKLIVIVSTHFS
jgi:hypothetical protein